MKYVLRLGRNPETSYAKAPLDSLYRELPFDELKECPGIESECFVLSGEFPSGRKKMEETLRSHGAIVEDNVTSITDYVVVGENPSRGWKFGNYGNKINRAIELRKGNKSGRPLLVRESQLLAQIHSPKTTERHLDFLGELRNRSRWLLHEFESGYSDGWACCLPQAFRGALDIQKTYKREAGVGQLVWTQGNSFSFNLGDRIYDSREVYELPWGDALKTINFAIFICGSNPAYVEFDIMVPNEQRTALVAQQRGVASPLEFVRLLITGSGRQYEAKE